MDKKDAFMERMKKCHAVFQKVRKTAVPLFEHILQYELDDIIALRNLEDQILWGSSEEEWPELIREYEKRIQEIRKRPDAPEPIELWEGQSVPTVEKETDPEDMLNLHDYDFRPFFYEMLIPEDRETAGAVVVCAGGDHGSDVVTCGYQVCREFNELGYQAFLLLNRQYGPLWNNLESGTDAARAIHMIRANAKKYRISENRIAFIGASNGGLTGENCIQYYGGKQQIQDYFPRYHPDEQDQCSGRPDTFICVYGPRREGAVFDYSEVDYPPAFFAVGGNDPVALRNLEYTYPDLKAHNVYVEAHTFAGTPHGKAGIGILGMGSYKNFDLWIPLADAFMQEMYSRPEKRR